MASTTWADIQRLAADLQRVQLTESSKRLTDVNCVEVVSMLMSMGLVDLVVSTDGKEYITRKYLRTECATECLAAGGRIAITELASQLNVDLDHVNTAISQLLKQQSQDEAVESGEAQSEFAVCAGELLHRDFINDLCTRLDGRLQELGHLSMLQLTRQWELPTELLNQHVLPELGTRISAIRFEDQLCTVRYIGALKSKLYAIMIALTRPTSLANIHAHLGISQSLFFNLWNELAEEGRLPGKLLGSKSSLKSIYLPNIHERLAKQFIRQRFAENNYIELSTLKRLSITTDPTELFREILPDKDFRDLLFWPSVALSESKLWRECDSLAKNLLQSNHFCLLEDILPNQFTFLGDDDYAKIVERLHQHCNGSNLRATEDKSIVFEHPHLIQSWLKSVDGFVREHAVKDAPELRKAQINAALMSKQKQPQKSVQQQQKDDWEMDKPGKKGKAGKKGGSGGQQASGRSGKQKGGESDLQSAQDPLSTAAISNDELLAELERQLPKGHQIPESLWEELAEEFTAEANRIYRTCVAEAWQQHADSGEQQEQRRAYEQKMAKIVDSYKEICLFEKGADAFEEPICTDLRVYLLRSLCTELAQNLLVALADPLRQQEQTITAKQREQLLGSLESVKMQECARQLFDTLNDSMEKFHESLEKLGRLAGFLAKQPDKNERTDRFTLLGAELKSQLANCNDAPTLLLLAVLLALHRYHGLAVHASGKFVSPLINFLTSTKPSSMDQPFPPELASLLNDTQKLVVLSIKQKGEHNEQLQEQLADNSKQLKAFFAEQE